MCTPRGSVLVVTFADRLATVPVPIVVLFSENVTVPVTVPAPCIVEVIVTGVPAATVFDGVYCGALMVVGPITAKGKAFVDATPFGWTTEMEASTGVASKFAGIVAVRLPELVTVVTSCRGFTPLMNHRTAVP